MTALTSARHHFVDVDGTRTFLREAGDPHAPVVLLPHGYPASSYEFRNFIPRLADRYRLIAPDFPGFGYSDDPPGFEYNFSGYARFLRSLVEQLKLDDFVIWLHDYGSQIGLRLAIDMPERIRGLIIQNGDIYEDVLGPKYKALRDYFDEPSEARLQPLRAAVSEAGFKDEFLNDVKGDIAARISPDLWQLHWHLTTAKRQDIYLGLMKGLKENLSWFPRYQAYLREYKPPTLILWGPHDGFMPEASGRAYLRDLPDAQFQLLHGGHWLLETHLDEVSSLSRGFLDQVYGRTTSQVTPPL